MPAGNGRRHAVPSIPIGNDMQVGEVMRIFISLALNTARDLIRQPLIAVLTVACIVTIGIMPVIAVFSLGQEARIVRDGAVASCFIYGLFTVIFSSIASIFKQVRNGTAGSVLVKPVSREFFFMATYCGIVLVCFLFTAIAAMTAIISVRMSTEGIQTDWLVGIVFAAAFLFSFAAAGVLNYRGQNFCAALFKLLFVCLLAALLITAFFDQSGHFIAFGVLISWKLLPVALLIVAALAMLASIAVALSARFVPVVVFLFTFLVFILGLIADYLLNFVFGSGFLTGIFAAILPDWHAFWIYGDLEGNNALTCGYVLKACGYAALYVSGVLCLGVLSFKSAETR